MMTVTPPVDQVWKEVCDTLQHNLSAHAYNTWIASNPMTELRYVGDDRAIGVITSPTAFHSLNLEKNFYAQIKEVLDSVIGRNSELQFRVGAPSQDSPAPEPQQPQSVTTPEVLEVSTTSTTNHLQEENSSPVVTPPPTQPLPPLVSDLQEKLLSYAVQQAKPKTDSSPFTPTPPAQPQPKHRPSLQPQGPDLFSTSTVQSMTVDRARVQAQRAGLRLDYTFETFAVSSTNEMAHAAAQAVSTQPGTAYNPLFIYGGVGVGKTHLMHAVGNNILKNNPDVKIMYCTGEDFTNEIVQAIQTKKALQFKEKYRTVDVLLIDDVQFIAGKNTVQEEFFHTFNTITKRAGQVILTSDRPPHEIALLEDRLRSRFEAGLMVDIQQPSFELRTAILLIKANAYHLDIPMNLAQVIASKVDSARKIEGMMQRLKSEVELKRKEITPELLDDILRTDDDKPKQRLRIKPYDVIKTVANYYHIKQVVITGQQRVKSIVRARHVAMFFLKTELNLPYMEIGRWFSNRDHTSVMHALKKIETDLFDDMDLQQEVNEIRSLLVKISK